jgi:hypothetical protein
VRVLDDAVERKERTIVGDDRVVITNDEKTSTWRRVTCLRRQVFVFLWVALSLVLQPEVVRPDRSKTVTQSLFDLSVS